MCRHDCFWNCSTPSALSDVIANTSNDTDLVTTSEEEFEYTLIGMETQPRTILSEWTDDGKDPTQILTEIGDPIRIEEQRMKLMTKFTQISQMTQYLKNQIMRNRRLSEHERPDLLDYIALNKNQTRQHLTSGPKEIRPQLVSNNTTPKDPLKISKQ